jgi:hypothetical protein
MVDFRDVRIWLEQLGGDNRKFVAVHRIFVTWTTEPRPRMPKKLEFLYRTIIHLFRHALSRPLDCGVAARLQIEGLLARRAG